MFPYPTDAKELLEAAAGELRGGYITKTQYGGRRKIATANRVFVEAHVSNEEVVRWTIALDQLFDLGLVDNNRSETYYLTPEGESLVKELRKS